MVDHHILYLVRFMYKCIGLGVLGAVLKWIPLSITSLGISQVKAVVIMKGSIPVAAFETDISELRLRGNLKALCKHNYHVQRI